MSSYTLDWVVGLRASNNQYLTAEGFVSAGQGIAATSKKMKKKQEFTIESSEDGTVAFRTHQGKYLTCNGDGLFTSTAEENGEEEKFSIEPQADGRWAIKSAKHGKYCGSQGGDKNGYSQVIGENELFNVALAQHPHVCLRNVKRKTYMHLADAGDRLTCDEEVPWGADAVISCTFDEASNKYSIQAFNGKYLAEGGTLVDDKAAGLWTIEIVGKAVAFRGSSGKYLTGVGPDGTCKAAATSVKAESQWMMEDSWAQITLKSANGKFVSSKQGVEIAASATSVTDAEIFQLEPDTAGNWILKSLKSGKAFLWSVDADGTGLTTAATGTDITADAAGPESKFQIAYDKGQIGISHGGKFITQQMNGYLKCTGDDATGNSSFTFSLINRPNLVLRSAYGYVVDTGGAVVGNLADSQSWTMTPQADGGYVISGAGGGGWSEDGNFIGSGGETVYVELHQESKLCIKTAGGKYLSAKQQGDVGFTDGDANKNSRFEY